MRRAHLGAAAVLLAACASFAASCARQPPAKSPLPDGAGRFETIAENCARIASCAHPHDAQRFRDPSACVDFSIAHDNSQIGARHMCILHASTCEQVETCLHGAADTSAMAYCSAHPGSSGTCDGDRAINCATDDPDESTSFDCASLSATCTERHESGGLVSRACVCPMRCPAGAPEARCDGENAIITCHEGAVTRVACAEGTRCEVHHEEMGEAAATCEPIHGDARCTTLGAKYCDGDRLVECQAHDHFGATVTTDCAAFGLGCASEGAGSHCAARGGTHCEPHGARCEGEALAFCAAGREVRVSCAKVGLGACDPDAHGTEAACVTPH